MAAAPPLLTLKGVRLGFGGRPLFEGLDLAIGRGERACLVGRNGSGKSTLLGVIAGRIEADAGERVVQTGVRVVALPQDPALPPDQTVFDFVAAGLPADATDDVHRIDPVLTALELSPDARLGSLSGGEGRRAALARTLVGEADILLLDEPTNHLDLPSITWLEEYLRSWRGAAVIISHDRAFLEAVSGVTFWLDRGRVHRRDAGFKGFEEWADAIQAEEAANLQRLQKTIEREEHWLARGVTARRKRNIGRLERLHALRRERSDLRRQQQGTLEMRAAEAEAGGTTVIEAKDLTKTVASADGSRRLLLKDFSIRVRRGDRVGIVGRNGAGKTTLVRLLLGRLEPDSGTLKLGTGLEVAIFDQRRESLDPEKTLWETLCPAGGDSVMVGDRQRHVVAYLRDFLFDESQAKQPVKALSGGEKNRLILARLLARPSNLLVLDEPTNDLDMDTLDLLVEVLDDYRGTILLVSHDRDFLDRLTTSVVLLDGRGGAVEYPGGFTDALRQVGGLPDAVRPRVEPRKIRTAPVAAPAQRSAGKLSYKEQRLLDQLPAAIERLQNEIADLEGKLADPGLYARDPAAFAAAGEALAKRQAELDEAETRWLELEDKRESLAQGGSA